MRFGTNGFESACKVAEKRRIKKEKEQAKLRDLYDFVGKEFAWFPIKVGGIWVWLEYVSYIHDIKFRVKGEGWPYFGEMEYYMNSKQKFYSVIDK